MENQYPAGLVYTKRYHRFSSDKRYLLRLTWELIEAGTSWLTSLKPHCNNASIPIYAIGDVEACLAPFTKTSKFSLLA